MNRSAVEGMSICIARGLTIPPSAALPRCHAVHTVEGTAQEASRVLKRVVLRYPRFSPMQVSSPSCYFTYHTIQQLGLIAHFIANVDCDLAVRYVKEWTRRRPVNVTPHVLQKLDFGTQAF